MKSLRQYLPNLYSLLIGFCLTTLTIMAVTTLTVNYYQLGILGILIGVLAAYAVLLTIFSAILAKKFPGRTLTICLYVTLSSLLAQAGLTFWFPQLLGNHGEQVAWGQFGFFLALPNITSANLILSYVGCLLGQKMAKSQQKM